MVEQGKIKFWEDFNDNNNKINCSLVWQVILPSTEFNEL